MTPTDHISVPKPISSKFTTSGATNSGVPKSTCNFLPASIFLASPKSIIFTLFPVFVRQSIFSGYKNIKDE